MEQWVELRLDLLWELSSGVINVGCPIVGNCVCGVTGELVSGKVTGAGVSTRVGDTVQRPSV